MGEHLFCPRGHRWQPTFRPDVWPPDFRSTCPVCGEAPIGPNDITATTARVLVVIAAGVVLAGLGLIFISVLHTDEPLFFGIVLLAVGGLVIPLVGGAWAARKRTKTMAGIAEAMGFSFMASLTLPSVRAIAPFRLSGLGTPAKAYNAMQGRVGDCDVLFLEFQYVTGGGRNSQTYFAFAVILFDGAAGFPDFQLAPKTFLDKLIGFFQHNGIELEDYPAFSNRFKLSGPNEAALREAFHPDLVHHLSRDAGFSVHWFIEAADEQLLLLYRSPPLTPEKCPGLLTEALDIRDLLRGAGRRTG